MPVHVLADEERAFYCSTLEVFRRAKIEMLVGGAYAFARYTGIERHTKDLDVFVRERDFPRTMQALEAAGYQTEVPFPHWLGKAYCGEYFVDVIYNSGNGVARVDEDQLLYLRTRVLERAEAERLLVGGFLGVVAGRLEGSALHDPVAGR